MHAKNHEKVQPLDYFFGLYVYKKIFLISTLQLMLENTQIHI